MTITVGCVFRPRVLGEVMSDSINGGNTITIIEIILSIRKVQNGGAQGRDTYVASS